MRFLPFLILSLSFSAFAVEGMWLPSQIQRNIEQMQQMGLQINADDLYSETGTSLKDAIVRVGRGCTGSFISDKGLVITNHHCGYGQIQRHSSVENDYLTHGFWAANHREELVNDGLTVSILVRMEDVTERVLSGLSKDLNETEYRRLIQEASKAIEKEAARNGKYTTEVTAFYSGNQYYLFVYQVFRDVRMVGAPPSAIGKFGGDTDNWMWPRHSGDFMLFRVYADANNEPAAYSPDNQPYNPARHLNIAAEVPAENSFTMVYGFPGRTQRYLTSDAVEYFMEQENPMAIDLRTRVLKSYEQHMNSSDRVRIQYASKHAGLSNQWKKWQGENRGLARLDAVGEKKSQEELFRNHPLGGNPLPDALEETYQEYHPYRYALRLFQEAGRNVEIVRFALQFNTLVELYAHGKPSQHQLDEAKGKLKVAARQFFRDYHQPIDQQVLEELTQQYINYSDAAMLPPVLKEIKKRYGSNTARFSADLFKRTMLVNEKKTMHFLDHFSASDIKKLQKDPAFAFASGLNQHILTTVQPAQDRLQMQLDSLYRGYIASMMRMYSDSAFFPDANSTLRITYGKVEGSEPRDGVIYHPYTTASGILEKNAIDSEPAYRIPERLATLLHQRNYDRYSHQGELVVNFIASNHTTGGNSGSPVLNEHGQFIGINFDRTWESTMSDMRFDPQQCRNVSVSASYILWVIDVYAGMQWLLDEMRIPDGV
jgi:hypothetical protein